MKTFRFAYALIITKNLVPPFFISGCAGANAHTLKQFIVHLQFK